MTTVRDGTDPPSTAGYPRAGSLLRVFRGAPDGPAFSAAHALWPSIGRGSNGEFYVITAESSSNPTFVQRVTVAGETLLQVLLGQPQPAPGEGMTLDPAASTSVIATDGLSDSLPVTVELSWADAGPSPTIIVPPDSDAPLSASRRGRAGFQLDVQNLAGLYGLTARDWARVQQGLPGGSAQEPDSGEPDRHICWCW